MSVRVRYAPSPTGYQHIGGVRTALFAYLFAKRHGGAFVLRVEDTDRSRYVPEAVDDLYATLDWLGIVADEGPRDGGDHGPYVQSERIESYRHHARQLAASGAAYWDYSDPDERGDRPYHGEGRAMTAEQVQAARDAGRTAVLRLRVPEVGQTEFHDAVLGRVKRKHKDLPPDPVLLKSDGFPTYHLANVVDDHAMGITHVLRAQEWVPSTPIHLLLYRAFDWEPPTFAHLPMVMGKDGAKLSKRHGATSAREFRAGGYLAAAVINYVALLGWSLDGQREFFSLAELQRAFDLDGINKAPAVFDYKKLDWFNGQYIRRASDQELLDLLVPHVVGAGWVHDPPTDDDRRRLLQRLPLVRERLKTTSQVVDLLRFLYRDVTDWDPALLVAKGQSPAEAKRALELARDALLRHGVDDEQRIDGALRAIAADEGYKLGAFMLPLRVAVTGAQHSPPLIASIRELGVDVAVQRIAGALARLDSAIPRGDR